MATRRSGLFPLLAALAVLGVLSAGCGDDSSSVTAEDTTSSTPTAPVSVTPTETPTDTPSVSSTPTPTHHAPQAPSCLTVWVGGKRLPAGYEGCTLGGKLTQVAERPCEFGKPLVTFGTHFYAVPGGVIHHTASDVHQDKGYLRALRSCGG